MRKTARGLAQRPNSDRKAISETAMITLESYARSGIPLAREFLTAIRTAKPEERSWVAPNGRRSISPEQAVLLRARYLGAEAFIKQHVMTGRSIVERAAGMSPFGFNIATELPVTYIETDISGDFSFKPQVCAKISNDLAITPPSNLHFAKMDALTLEGIGSVSKLLKYNDDPLVVIDAGLMIYQGEEKFEQYVDAAKRLLRLRDSSIWIATDLCFRNREFIERLVEYGPEFRSYFDRIKQKLGVDYRDFFPNEGRQMAALKQKGFEVIGLGPAELKYELRFEGLEHGTMQPAQLRSYLGYLEKNFKTLVLSLRK
jgi:hypothetical protein